MQKQAPTVGRVLVMAIFALSCFSLLLFLWSAFGGPIPLKPHGYRFTASYDEATQLAQEADVRISGVSVGKVRVIDIGEDGLTKATIELEPEYAPLPSNTRTILRQKTLLGETYVELTPGSKTAEPLPEDGFLAKANTEPTVELDEIIRAFDAKTRAAFGAWMQNQGLGVRAYGADINQGFGVLPDFAQTSTDLLRILNSQQRATQAFIKNTGVVFDALSERDGQLADWITNSNRVFATTAARNEGLAGTFRQFPRFIDESNLTLRRLAKFADNANPVLVDSRPVGRQLSRLLVNTGKLAPNFKGLFVGLDRLVRVSKKGIPASIEFLDDARPLLAQLDPFLRSFNPFFAYLGMFKHELTAFFGNFADATQAKAKSTNDSLTKSGLEHYLRLISPLEPEALSLYQQRLGSSRSNAYTLPGGYSKLATGLDSFKTNLCGVGGWPELGPADDSKGFTEDLRSRVLKYVLNNGTTIAAPCNQQSPFTFGGATTDYPHVTEDPKPSNPYDILSP
ncbi:MAG: MlaD family protein [Solirubrobacterales bacterium]